MSRPIARIIKSSTSRLLAAPGRARQIAEFQYGGPEDPQDRRLLLSVQELERLLRAAKASLAQRVQIDNVGWIVTVWEDPRTGHRFETVRFVGRKPKAEPTPLG